MTVRDSGGSDDPSAEYLGVDTGVRDTPGLQIRGKVAEEGSGSTEIEVRFLRY
jgi:hypothetical protein